MSSIDELLDELEYLGYKTHFDFKSCMLYVRRGDYYRSMRIDPTCIYMEGILEEIQLSDQMLQ